MDGPSRGILQDLRIFRNPRHRSHKDHPGTRPAVWWRFEAEQQKLLSGAGVPAWAVLAYGPAYECGLPTLWAGFEEDDPPVFESQAEYLRRQNLLTTAEVKVLTADDYQRTDVLPADFEVLGGPFDGPDAEGVRWLNEREARIRARIPEARKTMGVFGHQQAQPN